MLCFIAAAQEEPPETTRNSLVHSAREAEQILESCTKALSSTPLQSSPSGDSLEEPQQQPSDAIEQSQVEEPSAGRKILVDSMLSNAAVATPGTACSPEVGLMLASCSSGYGSTVSACDSATATLACNSVAGELPFNPFPMVPFSLVCSDPVTFGATTFTTECSTTSTSAAVTNSVLEPPADPSVPCASDSALLPDRSLVTLPNCTDAIECLEALTQPTVELQLAAPADEECELVCQSPSRVHASASSECLQPGVKEVPHSTSLHVISRAAGAPSLDSAAGGPAPKAAARSLHSPISRAELLLNLGVSREPVSDHLVQLQNTWTLFRRPYNPHELSPVPLKQNSSCLFIFYQCEFSSKMPFILPHTKQHYFVYSICFFIICSHFKQILLYNKLFI